MLCLEERESALCLYDTVKSHLVTSSQWSFFAVPSLHGLTGMFLQAPHDPGCRQHSSPHAVYGAWQPGSRQHPVEHAVSGGTQFCGAARADETVAAKSARRLRSCIAAGFLMSGSVDVRKLEVWL